VRVVVDHWWSTDVQVGTHRLAAAGTRHDETRGISRRPQAGENIEKPVIPANAGIQVRTLLDLRPRERSRRWGESCVQKYFFPYPRTVSGFKTAVLHTLLKRRDFASRSGRIVVIKNSDILNNSIINAHEGLQIGCF
jgi:hypothetical protein